MKLRNRLIVVFSSVTRSHQVFGAPQGIQLEFAAETLRTLYRLLEDSNQFQTDWQDSKRWRRKPDPELA